MRQIKFRYWNSVNKEMFEQPEDFWDEFPTLLNKNDRWLEFTGLKDKNGKEIYEGDIVKGFGEEEPNKIAVVEWSDNYVGFIGFSKDSKVIGNIWEDKELLK